MDFTAGLGYNDIPAPAAPAGGKREFRLHNEGNDMSQSNRQSSRAADSARSAYRTWVDYFGVGAMALLLLCSLILFARIMALGMLANGYLFLAMLVLLAINAAHVYVQLPLRRNKLGKLAGGAVALVLSGAMIFSMSAMGAIQEALGRITGRNLQMDVIAVIVTADDPAQELADTNGYTFGYAEGLDQENTDELLAHIRDSLPDVDSRACPSLTELADALYDDEVGAIILNKGYLSLLEEKEGYEDFSTQTRIIYEHEIAREIEIDVDRADVTRKPFVIYCSGIDSRNVGNLTGKSNTDVNILAVVHPQSREILLLNTPRDYYVPLHMNGKYDKLTHAGVYGIEESIGTLSDLYNVDIAYYVRINFTGLINIVDALGGVDVESPRAFTTSAMDIPNTTGSGYTQRSFSFPAGQVHLTGQEALAFSRERDAFFNGDIQRGQNQMAVIKGIIAKVTSPAVLSNYKELLTAVADAFATNLSYDEIAALVQMQQRSGGSWNVTTYAAAMGAGSTSQYTYTAGMAWVMPPDYNSVNTAKGLIRQVLAGQTPEIPE